MVDTEGSESLTDAEAVNKTMETIHKVTKEFREAEPKVKLKDCQGIRVRSYQHQGNHIAGEKVWYQYKDGNAWHGPAEVIYHKGNTIFIHGNGDVKKVTACKVKPYDIKEGEEMRQDEGEKSPEPVEEKNNDKAEADTENNENNDETETETENDEQEERDENEEETENEDEARNDLQNELIGAKYLQVEKNSYFMDYEIFHLKY